MLRLNSLYIYGLVYRYRISVNLCFGVVRHSFVSFSNSKLKVKKNRSLNPLTNLTNHKITTTKTKTNISNNKMIVGDMWCLWQWYVSVSWIPAYHGWFHIHISHCVSSIIYNPTQTTHDWNVLGAQRSLNNAVTMFKSSSFFLNVN